jgi:hypothetical protein
MVGQREAAAGEKPYRRFSFVIHQGARFGGCGVDGQDAIGRA